jgi:hypothetical protein
MSTLILSRRAAQVNSKRLMRRNEAAKRQHDLTGTGSPKTLAKLAVIGGGPPITYLGRIPLYEVDAFDAWVESRLSRPVRSTSERRSSSDQGGE